MSNSLFALRGHTAAVSGVSFCPKGGSLVSSAADGLRYWILDSAEIAWRTESDFFIIRGLGFSPDSEIVATGSGLDHSIARGRLTVFRALDGKKLFMRNSSSAIESVSFSTNGDQLASGHADGTVRIRRTADFGLQHNFRAHLGRVFSVAFSPDGGLLATGGGDLTVKLWRTSDWSLARTLLHERDDIAPVTSVQFYPDSEMLVSSQGQQMFLWTLENRVSAKQIKAESDVVALSLSPEGSVLAAMLEARSDDAGVKLWGARDGDFLCGFGSKISGPGGLAFDAGSLLAASNGPDIHLWKIEPSCSR